MKEATELRLSNCDALKVQSFVGESVLVGFVSVLVGMLQWSLLTHDSYRRFLRINTFLRGEPRRVRSFEENGCEVCMKVLDDRVMNHVKVEVTGRAGVRSLPRVKIQIECVQVRQMLSSKARFHSESISQSMIS